jgi:hypothetical protein
MGYPQEDLAPDDDFVKRQQGNGCVKSLPVSGGTGRAMPKA